MNCIKKGSSLASFMSGVKKYELIKRSSREVDVVVDLLPHKGFIRGNESMKAVYTFVDNKLKHVSIVN